MSVFANCSRRGFCLGMLSAVLAPLLHMRSALALPDKLTPLIREATGGAEPKAGRVKLTLPPLAESGNSVVCKVHVESPMAPEDHVTSIHLLSEKNPRPVIARFYLGPRSGRAEINTRIRLAASQQVVALAVMKDGSCWTDTATVIVTAAACGVESKEG